MAKKKRATSARPATCNNCKNKAEAPPGTPHRRCPGPPLAVEGGDSQIRPPTPKYGPKTRAGTWT